MADAATKPTVLAEFEHQQPVIDQLIDLQDSIVFQDLWREHKSKPLPCLDSLEKLFQFVIQPVFDAWKKLYLSIKGGTVTASDVQKYFGKVLCKEDLEQELKIMLKVVDSESCLSDLLSEQIRRIHLFGRKCFLHSVSNLVSRTCEVLGAGRVFTCPPLSFDPVIRLFVNSN